MENIIVALKRQIHTVLKTPMRIPLKILETFPWLSTDKFFLELLFREKLGYRLDLDNPTTFNEKLNWLKLYYRDPEMCKLVDKYEAKRYVADKVGEEYIIPTFGIWDTFDEIDFDKLPNQFVLKTTHDGGGVVICSDKRIFDMDSASAILNRHLKSNHYNYFREWPYKNVKPRIIAEKFIGDKDIKDYKFYCFEGEAKVLFIASGRNDSKPMFDFYDIDFNHLDIRRSNAVQSKTGNKIPKNYHKMVSIAETLSETYPHVRVDFYNIDGNIYFGEFTFFTGAAVKPFYPEKWDRIFGDWINLPKL